MASYANIQGMFKQRYGRWIEPLPDEHTLADFGDFIPQEQRPGLGYNFPVLTGIEHGQTANTDGSAFSLNSAIDSRVLNATLDGATIVMQSVVSYDVIYKSLNGTGNGNQGGAYKTALDQAVQAMLMGGAMYRELALAYGPGTSNAAACNIGSVNAVVSGSNLNTNYVVNVPRQQWIPGLWVLAQNMKVDILNAAGTSEVVTGVTILNRPSTTQTQLTLFKAGDTTTVIAAGQLIVPTGWRTKSCFGLEAIYKNTGDLFGINSTSVPAWKCMEFSAGSAALTRAKIMQYAALVSVNGLRQGGKLFVSAPCFAYLASEFDAISAGSGSFPVTQYAGNQNMRSKEMGTSTIKYVTAAGVIEVVLYQYAKQGQAFFVANNNFRRVGSTDLTMRPIGGGAEAFFTHLTDRSGAQMKVFSNQAPVLEIPYRNFIITGIQNSGDVDLTGIAA